MLLYKVVREFCRGSILPSTYYQSGNRVFLNKKLIKTFHRSTPMWWQMQSWLARWTTHFIQRNTQQWSWKQKLSLSLPARTWTGSAQLMRVGLPLVSVCTHSTLCQPRDTITVSYNLSHFISCYYTFLIKKSQPLEWPLSTNKTVAKHHNVYSHFASNPQWPKSYISG